MIVKLIMIANPKPVKISPRYILALLLLFCFAFKTPAQKWEPGYIVPSQGGTVNGYILKNTLVAARYNHLKRPNPPPNSTQDKLTSVLYVIPWKPQNTITATLSTISPALSIPPTPPA